MRHSIKAALTATVLLLAGASGAMAGWGGYYYGAPSPLGILSALAAPPVGYVVETRCVRRHVVTVYGAIVSRRICGPVQVW